MKYLFTNKKTSDLAYLFAHVMVKGKGTDKKEI